MKTILQLGVFLLLTNCTMKHQKPVIDHSQFQELDIHKGSGNYVINEIFRNEFEIVPPILIDSISENIIAYGFQKRGLERNILKTKRLSNLGDSLDVLKDTFKKLNDGTMWDTDFYVNWITDGDTTKHHYLDPFSKKNIDDPYEFKAKEKDAEKWMKKFDELYYKAQYVHIYANSTIYYFKIDDKWYLMKANIEGLPDNLKEKYPQKEAQEPRILELESLAPLWYHKGFKERDTSLIKMIDYKSTFYEEKNGLDNYTYSAGWWYLEIYMPLGDTLKIKRYSYFEDPDLKLYKIPAAYGGRNDVLFIVQKPNKIHIEQVGGMYAIRPRDPEQPERRYKRISYGDTSKGQPHILKAEETEEYKAWKEKQKG